MDEPKIAIILDAISEEIIESMIDDWFAYLDGLGIFWAKVETEKLWTKS